MAKFYVVSGNMKEIVDAPDKISAAVIAVRRAWINSVTKKEELYLANFMGISEKGFSLPKTPDDEEYDMVITEVILNKAHLSGDFSRQKSNKNTDL